MKKQSPREAPDASPFIAADQLSGGMIRAVTWAGEACAAWGGEIIRFANERARRDTELGLELLRCRDWSGALKLQQNWVASTTQDYVEEGTRLLKIASQFGDELGEGRSQ